MKDKEDFEPQPETKILKTKCLEDFLFLKISQEDSYSSQKDL